MAKKKSITRISDKKRGRPKIRFSFWGLITIFLLSFAACFILYIVAANFNENFFSDEFENVVVEEKNPSDTGGDSSGSSSDSQQPVQQNGSSVTNPIAQSQPKNDSYLSSCCLVTDNSLIDMGKYTALTDIIGSGELGASNCNTYTLESSYGTKTVYEILQTKKPEVVYIMLGDDIGTSSIDDMISSYTELVKNVRGYLTDADIYIMQLPPASDGSAIDNGAVNEFNTKLLSIANTNNVYCIDTNTALKGVDGNISKEFINSETGALTEKAYKTIAEYVLCHTV